MSVQEGLRERKKRATRVALQDAALRLALERGPQNVRVDDIAEAAGVSPRTYNNYFSSREQAIIAAVTAEREQRIVAAIVAHAPESSLSEAVISAIADHYAEPGDRAQEVLVMLSGSPALRAAYADSVAMSEQALADALLRHSPSVDAMTACVLGASIGAAARVGIQSWLTSIELSSSSTGLVVPSGRLPDRLRDALAPLAPALDAAAEEGRCSRVTSRSDATPR